MMTNMSGLSWGVSRKMCFSVCLCIAPCVCMHDYMICLSSNDKVSILVPKRIHI